MYLYHHGILGQEWGKKNGPPYPLGGGDYSRSEKVKIYKERKKKNSIYNKKHFDKVISTDKKLSTLSYDKDRTKKGDMFYATYETLDKHQYNALFNKKVPQPIYDDNGNEIGTGEFLKFKIDNKVNKNIKVASEDSAAESFRQLYSKDRDFYNFVTDPNRMQRHFVDAKYGFKGYRESRSSLEKLRSGQKPNEKELQRIYRMFNYVIPSEGTNAREKKDVATQRAKFFNFLQKQGYGAVLDTNDAIYGGFKATAPVIVFDRSNIVPSEVKRTTMSSKRCSQLITVGRKVLKI